MEDARTRCERMTDACAFSFADQRHLVGGGCTRTRWDRGRARDDAMRAKTLTEARGGRIDSNRCVGASRVVRGTARARRDDMKLFSSLDSTSSRLVARANVTRAAARARLAEGSRRRTRRIPRTRD